MDDMKIIDLNPDNISDYGVCGYKDLKKHVELRKKIEWFQEYYPQGLRIKIVMSKKGGYQGMLEYIPGEYAHRPVEARGYMFIHCVFVGFRKEYKGQGMASILLDECIQETRNQGMLGVAVVTRKGPFMAGNDIFLNRGFQVVDSAQPDFNLMVKKFDDKSPDPKFRENMNESLKEYSNGLTILRSVQCPYTEKNVNAIIESAENKFKLETNLVDLENAVDVQNSPCAFGSFCLIYDGKILSYHPISKTRFENIMKKELK
ncbi:GNAT family N-acetyltransferase [Methanobacterium alcaliphilum]|uniref:GNAT family N-acetyltransferase n=1 Tax=Methanobacterium alcaliphilum TaxID=392018 RepID=UPI00200AA74A|nr:GNAT family N-acetyltransferase [Methanobacterium alcaliphilum]MCK9150429.1 N-acetyltransferase [Methanobacterium alcaliphilum]